jgi:hypothetical protein
MKKYIVLLLISIFAICGYAQDGAAKSDSPSLELAKATQKIYGGDKFKNMKTLVVRGTTDISGAFPQPIAAAFVTIYAGEKYRLEIDNPFQPFKQIFDGEQTFSSIGGVSLPPINRLGLPLLQRFDNEGFKVTNLPELLKKKKGFRITSPEGYYTDFIIDEKNGQVKSYEASYDMNGRNATTSVEIDKVREVDGVLVPENYSQRFDLSGLTIYSAFKAKIISVNAEVKDDVFVMN